MITYLALGLLLIVVLYFGFSGRDMKDQTPKKPTPAPQVLPPAVRKEPTIRPPETSKAREVPKELSELQLTPFSDLPGDQAQTLLRRLQNIPRPPRTLDKLVSAEFLANASSATLSELMAAEPQIAAKVLANVNAPIYGLKKPLESMGQAITYLGMNTVRGICMQYMLDNSFKAASPDLNVYYETIWEASACASELCSKLAQLLNLPEPGNLVTQVVLSYIGPLTTYSLLDRQSVIRLAQCEPIDAARFEQEQLGLCASEMGAMLMQSWQVPESLIQDVRDIDHVMVTPCTVPADARSARLALCYLCKRWGMMLATGEIQNLHSMDLMNSESLEYFYLPDYLQHPSLARLLEFLQFPEIVACTAQMTARAKLRYPRASAL